ncbi:MAG: tetratricopeptide repeat protein [Anaerolineales bacterium]|nr:tetratricopeptide repeat protein [Anaerolineales bacterium]
MILIAIMVFFWQTYVPAAQPLFIPTPTPTRSAASYVLEGENLFKAGNLEAAEAAYLQAIAADPREIAHYIELARVRVFAGEYTEAENAARDALVIDSDSALAHAMLGWALDFKASQTADRLERETLLAEALTEAERALDLNPNAPEVRAVYAEVLIDNNINAYEEALENARAAVALENSSLMAHRALAYVWERTGNPQLALESYQAARSLNPNLPSLHIDVGNMLRVLSDIDGAKESYLKAITLAPTDTLPLTLLVQLYANVGEYAVASQYAQQAVALDPSNPRLHGNLGRMYYHNGLYEEAAAQFELAIRGGTLAEGDFVQGLPLNNGDDSRVLEFYYTYGLTLAKLGVCDDAVDIFRSILQAAPEDEIAVFNAEEGLVLCGELERTPTPDGATETDS